MKNNYYATLAFILFGSLTQAQTTTVLNQNNVAAEIQDEGFFFNNTSNSSAGYEVSAGSGSHSIYSSSFWMGGSDINGQLKVAAQRYFGDGLDFRAGPLNNTIFPSYINPYNQTIWQVTKAEIDYHLANYNNSGYVVPNDIQYWPAHGDVSYGMDYFMAPYVDMNNDGNYNPQEGDHPCIKGDEAVYIIMNDNSALHMASNADPIGVELHYMFYQFSSVSELEGVTFIDLTVLNKGAGVQAVYDFKASYFVDADLGYGQDDYVGCDTTRNMVFTYNGDAVDESGGGVIGYGVPPAIGVACLSHNMDYNSVFSNGSGPQSDPTTGAQYYNVMQGNWVDGSDQLDDNGNPTDYMFHGDPNDPTAWSEVSEMNPPGDRRMVISSSLGILLPEIEGEPTNRILLTYAVMHAQGTDNLNSVTELYQLSDFVQNYYNGMSTDCFDFATASIEDNELINFTMHPNPTTGHFEIQLPSAQDDIQIEIVDVFGRVVVKESFVNTSSIQLELSVLTGIYFVNVKIGGQITTQRLIKQ